MAARRKAFRMDHPVIITFLVIAVVASMALAAEVLKPIALAVLLSFALSPFCRFLEARRIPRAAAVCSVIVLMLGLLVGFGYIVGNQLTGLARDIPRSQANIEKKLRAVIPRGEGPWARALGVFQDIEKEVGEGAKATTGKNPPGPGETDEKTTPKADEVQKVSVVSIPTFRERLAGAIGPYLEFLSVAFLVLILSLFMLMNREDLGDRITRLFGRGRITLTTRTMDEVGARISRYLGTFVAVNTTFGLIIGTGLALIGVPYAILWGFLAGVLRFVPYVGAAVAFGLPLIFSIAHFPGWFQPLAVVALFGVIETAANSFLEPVIYGKTTGVSALGLLIAAMFWTWLWGMVGLLVSTPLTVCLAVLGKYVPSLGVFATLLGEEVDLGNEVRLYQRLLALDQDGATEIVDEALKAKPQAEVFDTLLIPALSQSERDRSRDEIDDVEREFIWRVVGDVLDDLQGSPGIDLKSIAAGNSADGSISKMKVVGVPVSDRGDALALRMLEHLLKPSIGEFEILGSEGSPMQIASAVSQAAPSLVVLSHLPPVGLTAARYLVHRLRAQMPGLPIVVGRWGDHGDVDAITKTLTSAGASKVAFGVAEARDKVLEVLNPAKASKLGPAAVAARA